MIFAYLDPGAGSMVIQMLLAAALTVPFFFKSKLSAGIRRLRGQRDETTVTGTAADETTHRS